MDLEDNNLAYLEAIHNFVEVLNEFFHNVCELDLVFNFYKVILHHSLLFCGLVEFFHNVCELDTSIFFNFY